jgi:hypothetical protein
LSSFGTLVADIAAAVWSAAVRTITGGNKDATIDSIAAKTANIPASPAQAGEYTESIGNVLAGVSEVNAKTAEIAQLVAAPQCNIVGIADAVSTEIADKVKTTIEADGSFIALIKGQTDKLTFDSDDNLMTDSSDISTEVAAIKEKTDQLVFDSDGNLEVTATVDEDAIAANVVTGLLAAPEFARLVPGTGAYKYEFNVKYNGTVASLPDVSVYLYNASTLLPENIVAYGLSNNQGVVNFYLNAGTYYAVQVKAGYTFENPEIITVEAT